MARDNGWITPVHETHFATEIGDTMVRVVVRRKTGKMRIYIQHPDGTRLGLSVDNKHILAARGNLQNKIVEALDAADKVVSSVPAQQPLNPPIAVGMP